MSQTVYLAHHGIKGQKWGVRRFQNKDGTRTSAGKKRYSIVGTAKNAYNKRLELKKESERQARIKRNAIEGYTQDMYDSNVSFIGKMLDDKTGNHRKVAKVLYEQATPEAREARAKQYEHDLKNVSSTKRLTAEERRKKNQAVTAYRLDALRSSGNLYDMTQSFLSGNFDYTGRALYVMATPERRLEVAEQYVKEREEFNQKFEDFVSGLNKRK